MDFFCDNISHENYSRLTTNESCNTYLYVRISIHGGDCQISGDIVDVTLQHTATHCNTLQHNTTLLIHGSDGRISGDIVDVALQHTATQLIHPGEGRSGRDIVDVALQYTATHCNTLQHTATHRNTLQH